MDTSADFEARPASSELVGFAADIVAAYVTKNSVRPADLPELIGSVHASLKAVASGATTREPEKPEPAVNPKKSVTPDYLISLFDGRKYRSLKRHIRTAHDMTPEQYRAYWGLPADYPMVAPNYAAARSALAKSMGLGQKRRKTTGKRVAKRA
jgi:predicted transcriptional regulator